MRSFAALLLLTASCAAAAPPVILVTIDGLRWQEVMTGAEEALLDGVSKDPAEVAAAKKAFWRPTPEERRAVLMPYLWSTIVREGQLHPNGRVTNGLNFSYPGYQELLAGFPDPRIDSNRKIPNPNVTVLEWLNGLPAYRGRVAAFCSWDVFPSILNVERSGLPVNAGGDPFLAALQADLPAPFKGAIHDAMTFHPALDHLKRRRPRVLYVALGECDEFAHEGKYVEYLRSARRADDFVRRLLEAAGPGASLVLTTDHGRGDGPTAWKSHGKDVKGAERVWLAAIGPLVAPLGLRDAGFTQAQIAATVAAPLGEDWRAAEPRAAPPLLRPSTSAGGPP